METINHDGLLYSAYLTQQNDLLNNIPNWVYAAKNILDQNGLSYLYVKQTKDKLIDNISINNSAKKVRVRIEDTFIQKSLHHIKNRSVMKEGKLVFYGKIKDRMRREPYLKLHNIEYRNALRDIRISTHKLNIEVGRYEKKERSQRLCESCDMKTIESEEHFLLNN